MILAALAIRLVVMMFLYPEQIDPYRDHWRFGYETGRIARSLAEGEGFSSPLYEKTGPTAWMTPLYPLIVAGFFKVFGVYTKTAAFALLSFNALISAVTCVPLFYLAREGFGERVARVAGWTWVFFPYAIYFPEERIWETWLSTLLLCVLVLLVTRLREKDRLRSWVGVGALWGVAALNSAIVLAVLPGLHAWVAWQRHREGRRWLLPSLMCFATLAAVVSPWFVRNYVVFHRFIPFRDNGGLVARLGTRGPTDYWAPSELGPWKTDAEWNSFKTLGELGYMDRKMGEFKRFLREEPGWYARTAVRRFVFVWTGYWSLEPWYLKEEPMDPYNIPFCTTFTVLTLYGLYRARQENAAAVVPYLVLLVFFPFAYYFTTPEWYYRRPLDPVMIIPMIYGVMWHWSRVTENDEMPLDREQEEEAVALG
jgi:4-amino-4-deoxy-L-arabinose transferase-like glycosyltransferase